VGDKNTMNQVNTVVVISDRQELVNQISQKLVLLRNLDKIKSCSIDEAQNMLEGFSPNAIILHCENNNTQAINLIKQLKKQVLYKNVPILLINENCSRETIIGAFDEGISDILFVPIIDYELLIRVIWCLQKNELCLKNESRMSFMTSLGIVQSETGVYTQKYCDEFLRNEIAQTKKYSQHACVLLIAPDKKYPEYKNPRDFISIIKDSIRLNDSIAIKDVDEFYIYLQKTKLNGAYSVFERINSNLGINAGANAGVVEIQDQKVEDIVDALNSALAKANENTNSLIVASDFYSNEQKPKLNLETPQEIIERSSAQDKPNNASSNRIQGDIPDSFDKNSIRLFNQAYKRKLKVVIEPVFKKFEHLLRIKHNDFAINSYTGTKSCFSVSSGSINASFNLEYDGIEHASVRLMISDGDQKRLFETETIDFTILDHRKTSMMLSELIDKFLVILKGSN
jgi:DNA-binding NarL/FixJ family response regulator